MGNSRGMRKDQGTGLLSPSLSAHSTLLFPLCRVREELDGSLPFAFGSLCAYLAAFHYEMKNKDERKANSSRTP